MNNFEFPEQLEKILGKYSNYGQVMWVETYYIDDILSPLGQVKFENYSLIADLLNHNNNNNIPQSKKEEFKFFLNKCCCVLGLLPKGLNLKSIKGLGYSFRDIYRSIGRKKPVLLFSLDCVSLIIGFKKVVFKNNKVVYLLIIKLADEVRVVDYKDISLISSISF